MDILKKYFPEKFTHEQWEKFELYYRLIRDWNAKINLISRKDEDNFEVHHLLHSLLILKVWDFSGIVNAVDVGTGGGLPGIPLAIALPSIRFTLIDGRKKKIMALNDMIEKLQLTKQVKALPQRSEELKEQFSLVTGRAVTQARDFIRQNRHLIASGGHLLYWSGSEDAKALATYKIYSLQTLTDIPWFKNKVIIHYHP